MIAKLLTLRGGAFIHHAAISRSIPSTISTGVRRLS
jgi:hypothetical protein